MALTRAQHWATRSFHTFLEANANTPYEWGKHDCCTFVGDAIAAMTGVDIAAEFRGLYTDEASAMEAIKTVTGESTIEDAAAWCATKHGLEELQYPLLAQRGDMVVFDHDGTLSVGLIHLSGRHIVAAGGQGLKRILIHDGNTTPIKRAWRV